MVGRINAKLKVYGNYVLGQLSSAVVQLNGTVGDVTRADCQLRNATQRKWLGAHHVCEREGRF
jgi:hypothetical protein